MERIIYPELKSAALARAATAEGKTIQYEKEFRKLLTKIQEKVDRCCLQGFTFAQVDVNQLDYRFLNLEEKFIQDHIRKMGYRVEFEPDDELRDAYYFYLYWEDEEESEGEN